MHFKVVGMVMDNADGHNFVCLDMLSDASQNMVKRHTSRLTPIWYYFSRIKSYLRTSMLLTVIHRCWKRRFCIFSIDNFQYPDSRHITLKSTLVSIYSSLYSIWPILLLRWVIWSQTNYSWIRIWIKNEARPMNEMSKSQTTIRHPQKNRNDGKSCCVMSFATPPFELRLDIIMYTRNVLFTTFQLVDILFCCITS